MFNAHPFNSTPYNSPGAPLVKPAGLIILQAVIMPGPKTADGNLVEVVAPAWREIVRLLQADPEFMHQIDPRKWEELVASAYVKEGYRVTLTPRSGDFGRDVIAEKDGFGCVRILDQVKAYSETRLVDANDVRAMLGVLAGDRNASKGVVSTTADFAPRIKEDPYIAPFIPYRLELINGAQLVERLAQAAATS